MAVVFYIWCTNVVRLNFVGIDKPRGVWVEKNPSCSMPKIIEPLDDNDDRVNDQMNRIKAPQGDGAPLAPTNVAVKRTCRTFIVFIPSYHSDITDLLIFCEKSNLQD